MDVWLKESDALSSVRRSYANFHAPFHQDLFFAYQYDDRELQLKTSNTREKR